MSLSPCNDGAHYKHIDRRHKVLKLGDFVPPPPPRQEHLAESETFLILMTRGWGGCQWHLVTRMPLNTLQQQESYQN